MGLPEAEHLPLGVISDTHGTVDHRALVALAGATRIIHAGDIGSPEVIDLLERIAPVIAVHGNVDAGKALGRRFPEVTRFEVEGMRVYLCHVGGKPSDLAVRLPDPRPDVYIFGHSHKALLERHAGVLFLNPGAAGRSRFGGGLSVARLGLVDGQPEATIIAL